MLPWAKYANVYSKRKTNSYTPAVAPLIEWSALIIPTPLRIMYQTPKPRNLYFWVLVFNFPYVHIHIYFYVVVSLTITSVKANYLHNWSWPNSSNSSTYLYVSLLAIKLAPLGESTSRYRSRWRQAGQI